MMNSTNRRACQFQLLRYVPDAVRNEFVHIGVVLRTAEPGSAWTETEVRFTRDWRRVRCLDPNADTALLESMESELRRQLQSGAENEEARQRLMRILDESLSLNVQMTEAKAYLAESLPAGVEELMRLYVDPPPRERVPRLPDLVEYEIAFANDWADDLAIKTSATVPENAWLPAVAGFAPLANLNALTVTLSGNTVTINTGAPPPPGGGFEVRLRDFSFMPGKDPTLVSRTTVQNITFSRKSACDRFYVRMYDGAMPPNYSEFSAEVFVNLPLGS